MRRGSRLVEPDRIQAHDVEDAEIGARVETLDVTVPDLVDPFPGDRQQRRVLLHYGFGLVDQWQTLGGIGFPVDPRGQRLELYVVPERVVLRAVFADSLARLEGQRHCCDAAGDIETGVAFNAD